MKKLWIAAVLLQPALAVTTSATDDDFDNFLKEAVGGFDKFIDDANRDFISFMRDPWKKYAAEKPVEKRVVPEPQQPVVFDPAATPPEEKPEGLSIQEILDLTTSEGHQRPRTKVNGGASEQIPLTTQQPQPETRPVRKPTVTGNRPTPETKPATDTTPAHSQPTPSAPATKPQPRPASDPLHAGGQGRDRFSYCGIDYHISNGLKQAITLRGLDENAIADAYESLFRADWQPVVDDLKKLRDDDLNGNEWALFMLIKQVASAYAGRDESMVMRQFLLNQLGYKARMARIAGDNRLTLMVAPDCQLYGCIYVDEGGTRYYDVDAKAPYSFYMCKKDSPTARKSVSMSAASHPRMAGSTAVSTHKSPSTGMAATIKVPKALMQFYAQYPQCDYQVYAKAAVNQEIDSDLMAQLKSQIDATDKIKAAGMLLDFVQKGFEYATDDEQFGYEKPFFVEELFYYPKCDCEDRSILYRHLVKSLLGLDVVLLDYPDHIATAVRFGDDTPGDYVNVGGVKYTVCDPTYIGAGIGKAMPQYRNTAAKVLRY
ncbi:MAG: hypothetical protein K2L49_00140 [Muribaculaceae bacterium]|nr:hypothetical protein [Muribaculaceae bacterium]